MKKKDEFYTEPQGGSYIVDPHTGERRPDPQYSVETVTDTPRQAEAATPAPASQEAPVKSKKGE